MIVVLKTDQAFKDSPSAGHEKCTCSRCSGRIMTEPVARCWPPVMEMHDYPNVQRDEFPQSIEYRYCPVCVEKERIEQEQKQESHVKPLCYE